MVSSVFCVLSGLMLPPQLCLHTLCPLMNGLYWLCAVFPGSQFSLISEIQVGTPEDKREEVSPGSASLP